MPKALAAAGMISAFSEPTQPNAAIVWNCGTAPSCAGSSIVASRITNSAFRPGNRNFANVNAASESKNSTSSVVETATISVLPIDWKNATLCQYGADVVVELRAEA